jgi:signal recognition particle receptor subunit beta
MNNHDKTRKANADALRYLNKQLTRASIIVLENKHDMPEHWDFEDIDEALDIVREFFADMETMYELDIEAFMQETLQTKLSHITL